MSQASAVPPCLSDAPPPRWGRRVLFAWVAVAALGASLLFFFNPSQYGWYPYCVFYKTTGLQCPGCGSLRAIHQLLHGHVVEAMRLNLLFVCSLPLLIWWGAASLRRSWRGQPAFGNVRGAAFWAALALIVLFGVCRNLPQVAAWLGRM